MTPNSQVLFNRLIEQAKAKILLVSPPYVDQSAQRAFLTGYETALSDIAKGELDISEVPR